MALDWLRSDTYNKDTQVDAQFLLAGLQTYIIVFLDIWVQVLTPVDRYQKLLQDPACDVMTAGNALKKSGQSSNQKCDDIIEQTINKATSWGRPIPLEKLRQKMKIMPGELADDTVLSVTQNAR